MPLRRIRWSPWPFATNQVVTLYWIRSPQYDQVSHQWMTTAVFQDDARRFHDVRVPWGFLPWLKIGISYRNGIPVDDLSQGRKFKLDDLDQWDVQIAEAGQVISREWYPLRTRSNLAEYCWAFYRGAKRVIVSELEGIRALVTPARFLALGCLEPSFLDTIVRNYQINGDALYVQFSGDVPVRLLTRAFVLRVAYLLLDTSLRGCWDALYPYQLRSNPGRIQCPAPELRSLVVRGQTMSTDTLLVYEILQATLHPLPIKQILWQHPHSEPNSEKDEVDGRWRRVDTVGKDLVLDKRDAATGAVAILADGTGVIRDARGVQIRRWGGREP